jgi:hypothetical protein
VFAGCQKQPKQYPNVTFIQVFQDLKWNDNFTNVKNILETKYGLEFTDELAKGKNKDNFKVFQFEGGKFSGFNCSEWRVAFENDSLMDVFVMIPSETPKKCAQTVLEIRDTINNLPYEKFPRINYEWILHDKGKAIGRIQMMNSFGKGVTLFISTNKFINKYSYR